MEDYRNKVVNYYATQSQIISKFTGNTSKTTSKFTSKTNQIRLGGAIGAWERTDGRSRGLGVSVPFVRLRRQRRQKGKNNGYPFTTFTDFSDFLGIDTGSLVR